MDKYSVLIYHYFEVKNDSELQEMFSYEISEYEKAGFDIKIIRCDDVEDHIIEEAKDADVILCMGNPPMTRHVVENLPKLKIILRYGIGLNSIDLAAATDNNKIVYFMPGFCVEEIALNASSLILSLIRNTSLYDRKMREGVWMKGKGYQPRRLNSLTLGLFGFGGSGKILAKIFSNGFGSKVIACDPYVTEEQAKDANVEIVNFDKLLEESDIISIHAPLTKETRHTFSTDAFNKMKPTSMIINTSRGPLIDEAALIKALQDGQIMYAGLDVFEKEPIEPDNPLLKMDNVVLTPHSSYYGKESTMVQKELAASLPINTLINGKIDEKKVANRDVLSKITK